MHNVRASFLNVTTTTRRPVQLNQIVATEGGLKARTMSQLTKAYQLLDKQALLAGISRQYQPRDAEGEQLPAESTPVQVRVPEVMDEVSAALARMFDVTLTKDVANCQAKADIVVDGRVLLADAPVTFLMTLEKKLVDVGTFVAKLPVHDIAEKWSWDPNANAYATAVTQTTRTKKLPRNHVLAPATDKHPAQVQMYTEDKVVGDWLTVKFSGALPAERKAELMARVDTLIDAVRVAREVANTITVTDREVGAQIFGYLFA